MYWVLVASALVVPPGGDAIINAAMADVARRFAMKARVVEVERVTWRDGSLGCPQKGMGYTQALVPGWRVVLAAGSREFLYHSSETGPPFACPPGRAKKPLPGPAT
ncbi:MAG TPA: hypothetical protein VMZ74_08640 [Ramlibacter sp.]|nr:hypothetical protein [Ramlibacter sp.]